MNLQQDSNIKLSENIIIADADYIDHVTFELSVQFERMLDRPIPKADLSQWTVDVALDGGLRPDDKEHITQLVLVHSKDSNHLENFSPSKYSSELSGQAFKDDKLGEFLVDSYPVEDVTGKDGYILDIIRTVMEHKEVERVMIIPDSEQGELYDRIRMLLDRIDDNSKRITLFAMQPLQGGNFRQEMLGYSIMNALGIKAAELEITKG